MKLYALGDLHVGFEANRLALDSLDRHQDDWLVLGGAADRPRRGGPQRADLVPPDVEAGLVELADAAAGKERGARLRQARQTCVPRCVVALT